MNENDLNTVNFKCSHCGHIWSAKYPKTVKVENMQKCPVCNRFTESAIQTDNPWSAWAKDAKKKDSK